MQRVSQERREEEWEEEECSLEVLPITSSKLQIQKLAAATQTSTKATPSTLSLPRVCKTDHIKRTCTYNKQRQTSRRHYESECEEELHKEKWQKKETERWEYLWSRMESKHLQIPPFCCASLICYHDRYLVLFGGASSNTNAYHGLYVYDLDCQSWSQPRVQNENIATPRACHSSILVEEENVMLVYGGKDLVNNICYDEVLELNLIEWRWRIRSRAPPPPNGPGERWQHSAHYYDKKMFVLMGKGDGTHELITTDMLMPESSSLSSSSSSSSSFAYECMVWYLDLVTDRWHAVLTRPYLPITILLNDTSEQISTSEKNNLHSTYSSMSTGSSNSNARSTSMVNLTNRNTSYNYFGRPTMSLQSHAAALDGSFVYIYGGLLVSSENGRNAHLQSNRLNVAQETNNAVNNNYYYNNDQELLLNTHIGLEQWLYSNKLYRYHLPTNTWSEIIITPSEPNTSTTTSQPAPRYAATLTVINHTLYLFGGDANITKPNNYFGDLWMLELPPESTHWQNAYANYTNATSTLYKTHWVELKRDKSRAILAQSRRTEIQRDYMNIKLSRRLHVAPEEPSSVVHASSAIHDDHNRNNFTDSYRTHYRDHNSINYNNNNDYITSSYYSNHYKNRFTWKEQHEEEEQNFDDGGSNSLLCSRPQARSGHVCVLARGCLFVCGGEMPSCDSSNGQRYSVISSNTVANNSATNRNTSDRMVAYDNTLYRYPLGLYTTLSLKDNVCRWLSRSKENQASYALHLYNWNKCNNDDYGEHLLSINVEKLLNDYYDNR